MTKDEAYEAMINGKKVRHYHYTPKEYLFINKDGKFETEDGCVHGGIYDEFWSYYQKWEEDWVIVEENYTVWVGGVEVNDHYLTKEKAVILGDKYREDGYDDVIVEKLNTQS